ncbi:hypothetical protein [Actinomycetospora sp. NBRC 106378]|jgi:hypothetical protein|nr:hypothetical protein [Actinomycetospora sp. NBRC 106378]GLZ51500.1 hypothetical protein Acsp07_11170 [Actinomycetospora sp. NBRC 106378]
MRLGRRLSAGIAEDPPAPVPAEVETPEPAAGTNEAPAETRTPDPVSSGS